ncbi:MAG: cobalt transporter CbiM [Deltaproteobacteria bacterium]|nr:cobalt transporter CbiM [Deltaproteobacteria bacterium]MBW2019240.1 cobalt transporter CbiM [Deltaproteobacteria bacterium]MBW2074046.1 cobalt transporter CbiM [Deltaproteobacteria bacterium]RLB82489.1 MAG: cobalt transporter CbiM [Deltaproteobacteria bacterium]
MHISEGVLSPGVLIAGAGLTAAGVAVGLRRLENEEIPSVGILSAAFFVASLVHVPVGPSSVHLILNGLLGLILGWKAFPAILVGLALQALLFQFGGITTLGVNTLNMALPAVVCHYLFSWGVGIGARRLVFILSAFAGGCCAVFLSSMLVGFSLYLTGEAFLPVAKVVVAAHLPVMVIEGGLTAVCALFLRQVKPELLEGAYVPKLSSQPQNGSG